MGQAVSRVLAFSARFCPKINSSFGQKIFIQWTIYPALECSYGVCAYTYGPVKIQEGCMRFQVKGNPVKFRNGPAAVTGDENCLMSLFMTKRFAIRSWMGRRSM